MSMRRMRKKALIKGMMTRRSKLMQEGKSRRTSYFKPWKTLGRRR
jgi:hypothetical protein